jgi:hypothetical protein
MPEGLAFLWIGYIFVRLSTHPQLKKEQHGIPWSIRIAGIGMCFLGAINLDEVDWLLQTFFPESKDNVIDLLTILLLLGTGFAYYIDAVRLKKLGLPLFESKEREKAFSLITWDMWVVTLLVLWFRFSSNGS